MILQRARVHALIEARRPGAVWLQGPTGAGKTVALRTYLEQIGLSSLWVTLDERHREPSALFASITAASHAARAALPAFSPEHRDDPAAFARDFFAKLDSVLPEAQALVVDDVHLADDATALLAEAVDTIGDRRRLFFASQILPGPRFAPLLASSRLWTIGHRQLAFDVDEANGLAKRLGAETPMVDSLLAATDGWAAGLMLAMQLGPPSFDDTGDPLGSLRNPLAHLIATQVLHGVAPEDFRRLRVFADLPQVPMALIDLAGDWSTACAHLNRLADRGLFVERVAGDRVRRQGEASVSTSIARGNWRLHDLFRAALREAGNDRVPDPALTRTLVGLLVDLDRHDLAWQLAASNDATVLEDLVAKHGARALRDPSLPLLREVTKRDAPTPHLAYWRTRALLGSDEQAAFEAAEAAWAGFNATDDSVRKGLATSLAIFAMFTSIENVRLIAPWIERFGQVDRVTDDPNAIPDEQAIRCAAEVMHDMHFGGRASGAEVTEMQDRLLSHIVNDSLAPDETVLAGSLLIPAMQRSNRVVEAQAAIARIEALAAFDRAAPHIRASWSLECGYHHVQTGNSEFAVAAFERCLAIAEENVLPQTKTGARIGLVRAALARGDVTAAKQAFEPIKSKTQGSTGAQSAQILYLRARMHVAMNELLPALQSNEAARLLMLEHAFPQAAIRLLDVSQVQILHALGRHDESDALADRLMSQGSDEDRERTRVTVSLLRALRTWTSKRADAERMIGESFALAERISLTNFIPLLPEVAGVAAARALELGTQTDFVRRAIRARRLPAPLGAPSHWPWSMRVRVLGDFVIERDSQPMVFSGKAQQKPLELLKFLACERRMTADTRALITALWPDADGDAGRKNLEVTVSRLRKLLGDDSLVQVKEGRVSLDPARTSSDAREFIDVCSSCEGAMAIAATRRDASDLSKRLFEVFVALPFEHDEGLAWREGTRERFRNSFVRAVRALANGLEASGQGDRSVALLESALVREPLAEGLAQALMRAYIQAGEHAEAMRVYRQCRQMLSILIGAAPSPETERLKDSIQPPGEKQ